MLRYVMTRILGTDGLSKVGRSPGGLSPPWGGRVGITGRVSLRLRGVRWEGQRQAAAARGRGESRYRFPSQVRGHRAGAIGA